MDLVTNIAITLLGAVVGALLSFALPALIERRRHSARQDVLGPWFSSYQRYQQVETSKEWVDEKVDIGIKGSRFRFENSENGIGDYYQAAASLRDGELLGEWESIKRDGGHARGGLLLTIVPMGGLLYGVFTGPRETGERVYAAWVLARKKDDLSKGKRLVGLQILQMRNG